MIYKIYSLLFTVCVLINLLAVVDELGSLKKVTQQVRICGSAVFHFTTTTKELQHNSLVISSLQMERVIFSISHEGSIIDTLTVKSMGSLRNVLTF